MTSRLRIITTVLAVLWVVANPSERNVFAGDPEAERIDQGFAEASIKKLKDLIDGEPGQVMRAFGEPGAIEDVEKGLSAANNDYASNLWFKRRAEADAGSKALAERSKTFIADAHDPRWWLGRAEKRAKGLPTKTAAQQTIRLKALLDVLEMHCRLGDLEGARGLCNTEVLPAFAQIQIHPPGRIESFPDFWLAGIGLTREANLLADSVFVFDVGMAVAGRAKPINNWVHMRRAGFEAAAGDVNAATRELNLETSNNLVLTFNIANIFAMKRDREGDAMLFIALAKNAFSTLVPEQQPDCQFHIAESTAWLGRAPEASKELVQAEALFAAESASVKTMRGPGANPTARQQHIKWILALANMRNAMAKDDVGAVENHLQELTGCNFTGGNPFDRPGVLPAIFEKVTPLHIAQYLAAKGKDDAARRLIYSAYSGQNEAMRALYILYIADACSLSGENSRGQKIAQGTIAPRAEFDPKTVEGPMRYAECLYALGMPAEANRFKSVAISQSALPSSEIKMQTFVNTCVGLVRQNRWDSVVGQFHGNDGQSCCSAECKIAGDLMHRYAGAQK